MRKTHIGRTAASWCFLVAQHGMPAVKQWHGFSNLTYWQTPKVPCQETSTEGRCPIA